MVLAIGYHFLGAAHFVSKIPDRLYTFWMSDYRGIRVLQSATLDGISGK